MCVPSSSTTAPVLSSNPVGQRGRTDKLVRPLLVFVIGVVYVTRRERCPISCGFSTKVPSYERFFVSGE